MKRFIFKHIKRQEQGFVVGVYIGNYTYNAWLGYGKPIWWKPHFIGRSTTLWGIGFGWLLLCFRVAVIRVRK